MPPAASTSRRTCPRIHLSHTLTVALTWTMVNLVPTAFAHVEAIPEFNYQAQGMSAPRSINGFQPADAGSYPVFVYMTGTTLSHWSADDQLYTTEMAERGFLAVSVDWDTRDPFYPFNCAQLTASVRKLFDESDPGSAINTISDLAKADLSKGLVVAGFSQGGNIAALAKNFHPAVEAAFVTGHGYTNWGATCFSNNETVLPSERIRSIMGINDAIWPLGGTEASNRTMLERTTGITCEASSRQCIRADGSGWWLVTPEETADGIADHCFQYGLGVCGVGLDANFQNGSAPWAMPAGFDWLASFAGQSTAALAAAVLPGSRSATVNVPVTAFATLLNVGDADAVGCSLAPVTTLPMSFQYQPTDPATNAAIGTPDTPVDIAAGGSQTFVFSITPTAGFFAEDLTIDFVCENADSAAVITGVNTLQISASDTPVADVIALASTASNNGIVATPVGGSAAFSVSTANVGAATTVSASADTGDESLPVTISMCQTDPSSGACVNPESPTTEGVVFEAGTDTTATLSVFVSANGAVSPDAARHRVFLRLADQATGNPAGSTSVAVETF